MHGEKWSEKEDNGGTSNDRDMNRISTEEVKTPMAKMKKGRYIGADDIPVEEERCKDNSAIYLRTGLLTFL